MTIPILNDSQILKNLSLQTNPHYDEYYAFYSSWFGGITTNPRMMLLPIDDHIVHRGDGVFEAMKTIGRSVYLLDEHLQRLFHSIERIALKSPLEFEEMKHVILQTLKVANRSDVVIRIYLSRGPGNFSVNPYDSVGAQFYVVVTHLKSFPRDKYEKGVVIGKSSIPIKDPWMAQVKSCNYLPNVMMKKEAVDRNLDFVIGIDEKGFIAEGAVENIMIIDKHGIIVHPEFDFILKGTTMIRACELAREHGLNTEVRSISLDDLLSAQEAMMCGTSLDVISVTQFEGININDGKPGPIVKKLQKFLFDDMKNGPRLTPY